MASQFDELSKALASGVSRRELLRRVGVGLTGAALASLGVKVASAAPSECAVICGKNAFISGPLHAACLQACRECQADVTRICQMGGSVVCCASGSICGYNCETGRQECCQPSIACPGTCFGTCCPEA